MKTRVMLTLLLLIGSTRMSSAVPVLLTNTAVSATDICALFDCGTPVASVFSNFSLTPNPPSPDGNSAVTVLAGIGGGLADGLYLYNFDILNFTGSMVSISGYGIDFLGGPFGLDIDGGGVDTSWYCADCGGIAGSIGVGTIAPTAATFDPLTSDLVFFFSPLVDLPPGSFSVDFGVISTLAPGPISANLLSGGVVTDAPDSLAPVPEPTTLVLLGAGLLGTGALRRRRS